MDFRILIWLSPPQAEILDTALVSLYGGLNVCRDGHPRFRGVENSKILWFLTPNFVKIRVFHLFGTL